MHGKCALCNEKADIKNSHLIPKGFYKLINIESEPILTSKTIQRYTQKQVTKNLLCGECERRFSDNGEDYILKKCLRENKQFWMLDSLEEKTPLEDSGGVAMYDTEAYPNIEFEKLIYFAFSVFWRASVTRWKFEHKDSVRSYLGKDYQAKIQKYLLGKGELPNNMTLHVYLDRTRDFRVIMHPYKGKKRGKYHIHKFGVHGFQFILLVGRKIPKLVHYGCILNNKRIFTADWKDGPLFKGMINLMKVTKPSKRIIEEDMGY